MGGACSRRLYPRHGSASSHGSLEEDEVRSGTVIRGGAGGGILVHHGYTLRDGFAGGHPHHSAPRSFRVWSAAQASARSLGEGAEEGAAGSDGEGSSSSSSSSSASSSPSSSSFLSCISRRSSGERNDGSAAACCPSLATVPLSGKGTASSAVEAPEQCQLHGLLCPALPRPSLQERCVALLCWQLKDAPEKAVRRALAPLTKDLAQRVLDTWALAGALTLPLLRTLPPSSLVEVRLAAYPGVSDKWLLALREHADTLLSVDVADCMALTDNGLLQLLHANHLRSLRMDNCPLVSDSALLILEDCTDLQTFSAQGCSRLTGSSLANLACASALTQLDLERCPQVGGGMEHVAHCKALRVLNLGWCSLVGDADMRHVAGLAALEELSLARTRVTDEGIALLAADAASGGSNAVNEAGCMRKGMRLRRLSLQGCEVTDECFPSVVALGGQSLTHLDLAWCADVTDAALVRIRQLRQLTVLSLAYTAAGDGHASCFSELRQLQDLNLDSTAVTDASVEHLAEVPGITALDLSDTTVGNEALGHIARMGRLRSLNLSFTSVTDAGLRAIAGLTSLRDLNIDSRLISDHALANISTLTGLRSLDVFGAKITDAGLAHLRSLKALEALEVCGGGITDAGVRHLAALTALTSLNLSQNLRLADAGLATLGSLPRLQSLNLSACKVTSAGLVHLRGLRHLQMLALHSCRISKSAVNRALASPLCLWPRDVVISGVK